MTSCRRYRVSGRVQGVFFRGSTREVAAQIGVTGWVRNLDNGDVEALACGPEEALRRFEAWLREGPDAARVDSVDSTAEDCTPPERFEVR
jgi:acylphosphatase